MTKFEEKKKEKAAYTLHLLCEMLNKSVIVSTLLKKSCVLRCGVVWCGVVLFQVIYVVWCGVVLSYKSNFGF